MTALHKWTVTRRREIYRSITFTILRAHLTWAFVAFFSRQIFQPTLVNGILSHFAITSPPSIAIYTICSRSISFYHFYSLIPFGLRDATRHWRCLVDDDDDGWWWWSWRSYVDNHAEKRRPRFSGRVATTPFDDDDDDECDATHARIIMLCVGSPIFVVLFS